MADIAGAAVGGGGQPPGGDDRRPWRATSHYEEERRVRKRERERENRRRKRQRDARERDAAAAAAGRRRRLARNQNRAPARGRGRGRAQPIIPAQVNSHAAQLTQLAQAARRVPALGQDIQFDAAFLLGYGYSLGMQAQTAATQPMNTAQSQRGSDSRSLGAYPRRAGSFQAGQGSRDRDRVEAEGPVETERPASQGIAQDNNVRQGTGGASQPGGLTAEMFPNAHSMNESSEYWFRALEEHLASQEH